MSAKAEKNIKTQERVNYYKMLGVSASATEKDIKDSYHKLAKKFHPDKQKGGASTDDVTVDFTKIAEA